MLILVALINFRAPANAGEIQALDDAALSDVIGRDGLSFGADMKANIGSAIIGTTDSNGNPATLNLNNISVIGGISGTLDVIAGASGAEDYVNWAFPNLTGANNQQLNNLQIGTDLLVTANGNSLGVGIQLQNAGFGGTNLQLTGANGGGIVFGLGLNLSIGDILLQPNGRGITTGQMDISGVVIGAAGSNNTAPWAVANITNQPGTISVVNDPGGSDMVQFGIGWASAPGSAPSGSLQIGNITFTTPNGPVSLGSSSIGSMQIQYLNVKFKT